jgi:hypothetical protein
MIGAEELEWHGLGGVIVAHETSRSSLRVFYLCIVDCQVPQALLGAIEAKGISWRLILRPATKVTRDLWSRELLFSSYRPIKSADAARLGGRPRRALCAHRWRLDRLRCESRPSWDPSIPSL